MNQELAAFRMQLMELKKKQKAQDIEAKALLLSVRNILNPYVSDITELSIDESMETVARLLEIWKEMTERKVTIKKMEQDLNG